MYEDGSAPAADWSAAGSQRWTRGWRRAALASGMLVYPVVTAYWASQDTSGGAEVAAFAIIAAFCVCYAAACALVVRGSSHRLLAFVFGVMGLLFIAELPFAEANAFYLCAVVVSSAALIKRGAAVIIVSGVLAGLLVPWAVRSWHSGPGWIQALVILFTALTVYSSAENARAYRALLEARAEVARLASESERNRIARDLHDLLGHSLTAITVKSGLARRLAVTGSPSAVEEITQVERLSRQALAEVRAAVTGYREVTLAGELARGRELLRASGVTADLPTDTDTVDAAHRELFGWAVREGLTNVARHAKATRCTVRLAAFGVEILDDGVGGPVVTGSGLAGLRERAEAAGGAVEAGPTGPHGWRLAVTVPPLPTAGQDHLDSPTPSAATAPDPEADRDPGPGMIMAAGLKSLLGRGTGPEQGAGTGDRTVREPRSSAEEDARAETIRGTGAQPGSGTGCAAR